MVAKTIRLLIRALLIGLLVNIGLKKVAEAPEPVSNSITIPSQMPLDRAPVDPAYDWDKPAGP